MSLSLMGPLTKQKEKGQRLISALPTVTRGRSGRLVKHPEAKRSVLQWCLILSGVMLIYQNMLSNLKGGQTDILTDEKWTF